MAVYGRSIKTLIAVICVLIGGCISNLCVAEQTRIYTKLAGKIDARERFYALYLPDNYQRRENIPLVLFLHGGGGSAKQAEKTYGWREKAAAEGFAVAYPEGVRNDGVLGIRTWNAGTCCNYAVAHHIDDVGFIRAFLAELAQQYPQINSRRVYVTGMSNGAMMAYRLACEMPERIAAIAPVAGTLVYSGPCAGGVPLLHVHSTKDEHVPFAGGEGVANNYFPPVLDGIHQWQALNNCSKLPLIRQFDAFAKTSYPHCRNGVGITLLLTEDGGHSWPQAKPRRIGGDPVSHAFSATDVIWEFFQKQSRLNP